VLAEGCQSGPVRHHRAARAHFIAFRRRLLLPSDNPEQTPGFSPASTGVSCLRPPNCPGSAGYEKQSSSSPVRDHDACEVRDNPLIRVLRRRACGINRAASPHRRSVVL
jgi:hypothetical protein